MSEDFKVRVGTEFDAGDLDSKIRALLKDRKIQITLDVKGDGASAFNKTMSKMRENAKSVEKEFKEAFDIQKHITRNRRLLADNNIGKDLAKSLRKETIGLEAELNRINSVYGKKFSNSQRAALENARFGSPKQIGNTKDSYEDMLRYIREIKRESKDMLKNGANEIALEGMIRRFKEAKIAINELYSSTNKTLDISQLKRLANEAENAEREVERLTEKLNQKISDNIFNSVYDKEIANIQNKYDKLGRINGGISSNITGVKKTYDNLKGTEDVKERIKLEQDLQRQIVKTNSLIDAQAKSQKVAADKQSLELKRQKLDYDILNWANKNSAAVSQFGNELDGLRVKLKSCNDVELGNVQKQFGVIKAQAEEAGVATMKLSDNLMSKAKEYASYLSVATVAFEAVQGLQYMFQSTLEVDTAMTGLYRVTELTSQQYDTLYDNMISSAKEYGATLTETIDATADWVRAGFDADTALQLADITAMYQHISDLDYSEASKNLLTAYNGFKDSFNEEFGGDAAASVEHIADVFNELDNQYSVTSAGLGEGLARSASALELAGNTFEESAAMVGAMSEVTQDPEKSGNALKVLSLRLRGMKGELVEMGEEVDGNVENISKMQGNILRLTNGKVNIFDENGEFRSTFDIMKDIAAVYDELSSTQQADLLETIAGKDRANDVAALLGNMETAVKMVETGENAAGSAREENEKYAKSLQGALNRLTASWQDFSSTVMDSGSLSGVVDILTGFVSVLGSLIDNFGVVIPLATAFGAVMSVVGKGAFKLDPNQTGGYKDQIKSVQLMNASVAELKNTLKDTYKQNRTTGTGRIESFFQGIGEAGRKLNTGITKKDVDIIQKYNKELEKGATTRQAWARSGMNNSGSFAQSLVRDARGATVEINALTGAIGKSRIAMLAAEGTALAMNAALTMGISVAITAVISGITKLINAQNELSKAVDDSTNAYNQQHSSLIDGQKDFEDAAASYDKLSKGINKFTGENKNLTTEEYEEYLNVVNTIADKVPSLVVGYNSQGNAILDAAANVDTLTQAYKDLIIAENEAFIKGDEEKGYAKMSDVVKDLKNDYRDFQTERLSESKIQGEWIDELEEIYKSGDVSPEAIIEKLGTSTADGVMVVAQKVSEAMKAAGKELEGVDPLGFVTNNEDSARYLSEIYKQYPELIESAIDEGNAKLDEMAEDTRARMSSYLENAFLKGDYSNISEGMQSIVSSVIGSLDSSFIAELSKTGGEQAVFDYVDNMLSAINNLDTSTQEKITSAFDLKNVFDSGEISFGDYKQQIEEVAQLIDSLDLDEESKNQLKLSLNVDEVQKQYETLKNRLTGEEIKMKSEDADELLKSLSSGELEALEELIVTGEFKWEGKSPEDIKAELESISDFNSAMTFSINIEAETESLANLNNALKESVSATGLSVDSIESIKSRYKDLEGYNPAAIFEKTTTGVRLNEDALVSLEKQYVSTNKAAAEANIDTLLNSYKKYKQLRDEAEAAGNTEDVENYDKQLSDINAQVEALQLQAAAYDGLTSAYNNWINAKSNGEEGDMYDSIRSETEAMNEYAQQGLFGRNDVQSYADMFFADGATDNWDAAEYSNHWQEVVDAQNRYLTEGREGVDNFLQDMHSANADLIEMTDEGWEIKPNIEVEDIATAMNKSTSFVEAMLRKANDYGYDFEIGIDPKSVDELVAESEAAAQAANEALKQYMGEDFEISADVTVNEDGTNNATSQLQKLQQQRDEINNSDATVEVKEQGVEAVNSAIQAVIAQKIELEQPAFMSLDTSQVDASMADALSKAQEMQSAINNLNNLNLQQEYGIEIDQSQLDSANQKVQEIAQSIADNSNLKMSLGFEENASVDDIINKFKTNEITIDTKADTSQAEQDIDGISQDKTVDVSVNLSGDDKIAALESKMNAIDDKTIDASVSLNGDDRIASLESKMNAIDNKTIDVSVSLTGDDRISALESKMNAIDNKTIDATVSLTNDGSIAALESKMNAIDNKTINATVSVQNSQAIDALKNSIASIQSKFVNVSVAVSNNAAVDALKAAIDSLNGKSVNVTANVHGTPEVNALSAAIDSVNSKSVTVTATTSGTSGVNSLASAIASVTSKTVTITANYQKTGDGDFVNGTAHAEGTAHVNGTAFKQGKWGATDSGTALMGELGTELIVRGDKWFTVGDNGAGFYQYKKGDIIFNHRQTEELFKNGYVTSSGGRGRALAEGTAFASVSGGGRPAKPWNPSGGGGTTVNNNYNYNYNYNVGGSSSGTSGKDYSAASDPEETADEFEETVDFIEMAIDRIERALSRLDRAANNVYKNWGDRNSALASQITETRNEIDLQQRAYDRYMSEANSVGLSGDYVSKIQNGSIDIEVITDESLADKIKSYQEWYEKALDCKDAIDELKESESELYKQRFDNVAEQFEGVLGVLEHEKNMLDEFVSQSEERGWITSTKYYSALRLNAQNQMKELNNQRKGMIAELQTAVESGTIEKGSTAWYEMVNEINQVTQKIEECNTAVLEYSNSIRDIEWQVFDLIQERISDITKESDFLIELMSNEKLYDDRGQLTDKGMASMGLHGVNYDVYMAQADKYAQEIKKLDQQIDQNPYNQDLINRRRELIELQQESILAAEDEKNAIKDMVEEGIQLELDALDELVEKYKDSLQAQKD